MYRIYAKLDRWQSEERGEIMIHFSIRKYGSFVFPLRRIAKCYYHADSPMDNVSDYLTKLVGIDMSEYVKHYVITPTSMRNIVRGKNVLKELPVRKPGWGGKRLAGAENRERQEFLHKWWEKAVNAASVSHSLMKYNIYVDAWRHAYGYGQMKWPPKKYESMFAKEVRKLQSTK